MVAKLLCVGKDGLYIRKEWLYEGLGCFGRNSHSLSHPYQVSQRVRTHLSHELATMDLNGCFTSPNFGGYLLVEHARNHQRHHLSLPGLSEARRIVQTIGKQKFDLTLHYVRHFSLTLVPFYP